jgi:phosphatidylserine decarboxylase
MSIAREGWPYVAVLFCLSAGAAALDFYVIGLVIAAAGVFTVFSFRDPERLPPTDPRLVLSPADGRVVVVKENAGDPPRVGETQVSIFLSIFNVHVNRAPIAGRIAEVTYHKGAFLPAFDDKASLRNEQNRVGVEDGETKLAFTQIAGLIARRIVFHKRVGDRVAMGERVGLIKFGSRVDIFLPSGVKPLVKVGDRVVGGLSPVAERS